MPKTIALDRLQLADYIKPGDTIAWPQSPGEPLAVTEALVAQRSTLPRPELLFGFTQSETLKPEWREHFTFKALNGAGSSRRVTAIADIVPSPVSTFPRLMRSGLLKVDVALVQVRPLPGGGYTLGVIADFTGAMIESARVVIALLNPALPLTGCDARVEAHEIDLLVESDSRIIDMPDPVPSAAERRVAEHVAALIPDRATVQLGVGTMPTAIGHALLHHRELGVHTGVVSDVLAELVEKGVITNAHKGRDAGQTVSGGLFGTGRLRAFAEASGSIDLRSVEYTHDLSVSSTLKQFHAINSALEVDLSGQANAEVAGGRYLGAVGGLADFVHAGLLSKGGKSILSFASTTPDGKQSRIVTQLQGPVTVARSDAEYVVTEFGVAHLRGCGLRERARRLIAIAHPDFRESLTRSIPD